MISISSIFLIISNINPVLRELLYSVIILISIFLLGKIINFIFRVILKPLFARTKTEIDDKILDTLVKFDNRFFLILSLYFSIQYFHTQIENEASLKSLLNAKYYNFIVKLSKFSYDILFIASVSLAVYIVYKIINLILEHYIEKKKIEHEKSKLLEFIPLLRKVLLFVLITIGALIVLNHFNINISGIIVSLGIGSLAIALAAQETLANMIAGFIILIDRPFREGDRIKLLDGIIGDVYEIGIRSTKILDFDNNLLIVPNTDLVKTTVQNLSYPEATSRVVVDLEVDYSTDIQRAKQILIDLAKNHPLSLKDYEPKVFVVNFASSGISLRLILRTDDYRNIYQIQSDLREQILEQFRKENIEIPYQQIVIHTKK